MISGEVTPWLKQELRGGWLGLPEAYTPYDLLGVGLGTYFFLAGLRGLTPGHGLTMGLGLLMIWIHGQRFLYAPQDREGLNRLLRSLDIIPEGSEP